MTKKSIEFSQFLGVDVSKAKLDLAFAEDSHTRKMDNTEEAIVKELLEPLPNSHTTLVVLEATGG